MFTRALIPKLVARAPIPLRPRALMTTLSNEASDCLHAKRDARQRVKDRLKGLSEQDMAVESQRICDQVLSWPAFAAATRVGVYVHCAKLREVDTSSILAAGLSSSGKRCYVPVVEDKSSNMRLLHLDAMSALVSVPPYGIREPSANYCNGTAREDVLDAAVPLDMLLMPGLGFDRTGRRLGRGGGYYDKMLNRILHQAEAAGRPPPLLVALSYSVQLLDVVPVDAHDRAVDLLILPDGVLRCTDRGRAAIPDVGVSSSIGTAPAGLHAG